MNVLVESFDSLWLYCTGNERIVPKDWKTLYDMLANKKQKPAGGWEPPLPLILAAWHETSLTEKQLRFKEHLKWAANNEQIDEVGRYLRSLPEGNWYHLGDLL